MERKEEMCNIIKMVKCIDGFHRDYDKCIGFCNNICHKGFVTERHLIEHECVEKECTFLDPMVDHIYWQKLREKKEHKEKVKALNSKNKNIERLILAKAQELYPTDVEFVMCKHLYDDTYMLIAMKSETEIKIPKELISEWGVEGVFIKKIHKKQYKNIQYTYEFLLPKYMQKQFKRYKKMTKERT